MSPQVAAAGGKVLRDPTIVTIVAGDEPLAARLFELSDALAASAWWRTAAGELGLLDVPPR